MSIRIAAVALLVLVLPSPLLARQRHVISDSRTDFTTLSTFSIARGYATTTRAEINNAIVFQRVGDALRAQLTTAGLKESDTSPDVIVRFSVGQDRPNGPSVTFDEAVIVVQIIKRDSDRLIWHGTYRNPSLSAAKLAEQAPAQAKALLTTYPPKKK